MSNLAIDIGKMLARKDAVVKQNNDGIQYLFKKNKVSFFHGRGSFAKAGEGGYEIKVTGAPNETVDGKHVILATGSNRARCRAPVRRREHPVQRRRAAHRRVPKKLGVIGSGVIGLEMGSVWRRSAPR